MYPQMCNTVLCQEYAGIRIHCDTLVCKAQNYDIAMAIKRGYNNATATLWSHLVNTHRQKDRQTEAHAMGSSTARCHISCIWCSLKFIIFITDFNVMTETNSKAIRNCKLPPTLTSAVIPYWQSHSGFLHNYTEQVVYCIYMICLENDARVKVISYPHRPQKSFFLVLRPTPPKTL